MKLTLRKQSIMRLLLVLLPVLGLVLSQNTLADTHFTGTSLGNSPSPISSSSQDPLLQDETEFLPAREAFKLNAGVRNNQAVYRWEIADGYYLYKDRFRFESTTPNQAELGEPIFSRQGKRKQDPEFGEVVVFYHDIEVTVPVLKSQDDFIEIKAHYQGCAEKGLCYLPETQTDMFNLNTPTTEATAQTPAIPVIVTRSENNTDTESALGLVSILQNSSWLTILGLFFLLGIGLTFTPCVLPMLPILSGIIVGQDRLTTGKGFALSVAYVLGMAATYAIVGVVMGSMGEQVQVYMQKPSILFSFSAVFVLLSLSMFGFYELQLPSTLQTRLNVLSQKQKGGTYVGVILMGALSALIVTPCVTAPLAGALLYIANTGDAVFGGLTLFALGLGMGVPLVIVGTTGANVLPKAGPWMDSIKALFGVMLLGVALWLVKHLIPEGLTQAAWGFLAILGGLYLGALDRAPSVKYKLAKGAGLSALIYGVILIYVSIAPDRASLVAANIGLPVDTGHQNSSPPFETVRSSQELENKLLTAKTNRVPVIMDFYADWCTACLEMEHGAFASKDTQNLLADYEWLQIDLTNNPEARALLTEYRVPGPPSVLFFDRDGNEVSAARIYAGKSEQQFISHLKKYNL